MSVVVAEFLQISRKYENFDFGQNCFFVVVKKDL